MAPVAQTGPGNVTTAQSNSAATLTADKPSLLADGNLLLAAFWHRNSSGTLSGPAGWTLLGSTNGNGTMGLWAKPVPNAASETATTYQFGNNQGSARCALIIVRITGADLAAPLDAVGAAAAISGTTSIVDPAVTAIRAGCLLLSWNSANTSTSTVPGLGVPGGMSEVAQISGLGTTARGTVLLAQEPLTAAGSTGTRTATINPAANNVAGFMVTIAPGGISQAVTTSAETDSAQPLGKGKGRAAAPSSTTETAQALARRKTRTTSPAGETDTAQQLGTRKTRPAGSATAAETAQPLPRAKRRATTPAGTVEEARSLGRRKILALGTAVEAVQPRALAAAKALAVGTATEADTAQPAARRKAKPVTATQETAGARQLAPAKHRAVGAARETDTAEPVTLPGVIAQPAGLADVVETAMPLGRAKRRTVVTALETDAARTVTPSVGTALPSALIIETAMPIRARKTRALGTATEVDTAAPVAPPSGADIDIATGRPWTSWTAGTPYRTPRTADLTPAWTVGAPYRTPAQPGTAHTTWTAGTPAL